MTPVLLVGMPGSGKTTLSLELGRRGYRVCDLDRVIEQDSGKRIFEIIRVEGIERFRDIEYRSLAKTIRSGFDFIAAGGGLLTHTRSLRLARDSTTILCLVCTPNEIARRCFNAERDSRNSVIECKQLDVAVQSEKYKPLRPLLAADGAFTYQSIRQSVIALYCERLGSFAQADLFIASQFVDSQELADVVIEACSGGGERVKVAQTNQELPESEDKQIVGRSVIDVVTDVLLFDSELYRIFCETAKSGAKNWFYLFSVIYELVRVEEEVGVDAISTTSRDRRIHEDVELFYRRLLTLNPRLAGKDRADQLKWFVGVCAQAGYCGSDLFQGLSELLEGIIGQVVITNNVKQQAGEIADAELSEDWTNQLAGFHIERPGVFVGEL